MSIKKETVRLIEDNWEVNPSGIDRKQDVPQPRVVEEGEISPRSHDYAQSDVIFVRDGGFPVIEPASLGFAEEKVEVMLDIDCRTANGRQRLTGDDIDGTYEGMAGEVNRIFRKHRHGYGGYDLVYQETFDDQMGDYEAQIWAGVYNIKLVKFAAPITQDSVNGPS
jgi:hypothetical protein